MSIAADNPLGLRLPQQSPPVGEVMTRPRDVEAWIERLPVASATETGKQLFRTLQELNRTRLPPADRFQIAELLAKPIAYAVGNLENRYMDVPFPLSEKTRRTAFVCARLSEELGFAYKSTVHDLAMAKIGSNERKLLVMALFRSVRHLADVIYQTALVYQAPPPFIWRELHNLFTFAETNQWSATRIKTRLVPDSEGVVTTLRDLYLQSLLFAMAGPGRLRQREIRHLYRTLPEWTGLVRFGALTGLSQSDTRFVVQLRRDQPPQHIAFMNGPAEKPALELDTSQLVRALKERLDALPADLGATLAGQDELSRSLLRRLIQAWGSTPRRQFVRTRLNFELEVAVGLGTVHSLISGEGGKRPGRASFGADIAGGGMDVTEINMESTFSSDLLEVESGLTLVPMDGASNRLFLRGQDSFGLITEKEKGPAPSIWAQTAPEADAAITATLRTLNESAGGYCVGWRGTNIPGVKIGELIGIQAPGKAGVYGLAVVRWLHDEAQQGLQTGLQLLAPSVFAVTVTNVERRRRTPTQCLLVPELKSADRPASLIAPVMPFQVGESLLVRHGDTERRIRLVRPLEVTGAFAQFQFDYE